MNRFGGQTKRRPKSWTQRVLEAGAAAGLTRHQVFQALAVAKVPKDDFERLVESDNPPTIEELARIGRKRIWRRPRPGPSAEALDLVLLANEAIERAISGWPDGETMKPLLGALHHAAARVNQKDRSRRGLAPMRPRSPKRKRAQ